jgi:hypothetical protein
MIFLRKDDKDACSETNPTGCHGINSGPSVQILASEMSGNGTRMDRRAQKIKFMLPSFALDCGNGTEKANLGSSYSTQ